MSAFKFKLRPSGSEEAPPAWTRSMAGSIGAAAALGFGELASGVSDAVPSLVIAIGKLIADHTPGDIIAVSIATLGTSQKAVLAIGITLASLAVGGAIGRATTIGQRLPTVAGFAFFGVLGGWAAARYPSSQNAASWRAALSASLVGIAVTLTLIHRAGAVAARSTASPAPAGRLDSDGESPADSGGAAAGGRRAFLTWAGGGGAAALAMAAFGRHASRAPSAAETTREATVLPPRSAAAVGGSGDVGSAGSEAAPEAAYVPVSAASPVQEQVAALDTLDEVAGLAEYVTPNADFYRIDTALTVPEVDPEHWRLKFTGMVESPYELTFDEILAMGLTDHVITLSCVSNQVGGDLVGNAVWTGVPLSALLDRAGVEQGATQVVGRSVDGWTAGFPTDMVYDGRNAILAVGMNGEPLPLDHGFPARLVVAGLYGYVSAVKWIEEVELTTWEGFDAYWVPRGWSKEGPMKTQSRIDVPGVGDRPRVGVVTPIAGVAWAPTRGVSAVEARVGSDGDGGWEAWERCEIGEALGNESWVQWHRLWTPAQPGSHRVQVRATDGLGRTQGPGPVPPRPDGAEGWHTITVNVTP